MTFKTFMDKKDWAGAVQVYEQALQQFPDNGTLKNNLKFCLQEKEKK